MSLSLVCQTRHLWRFGNGDKVRFTCLTDETRMGNETFFPETLIVSSGGLVSSRVSVSVQYPSILRGS